LKLAAIGSVGDESVTVRVVVPLEAANSLEPEYVAVIVSVPTGAFDAEQVDTSPDETATEHNAVDPVPTATVPAGSPPSGPSGETDTE
jgi:hypothetical protein